MIPRVGPDATPGGRCQGPDGATRRPVLRTVAPIVRGANRRRGGALTGTTLPAPAAAVVPLPLLVPGDVVPGSGVPSVLPLFMGPGPPPPYTRHVLRVTFPLGHPSGPLRVGVGPPSGGMSV